MKSNLILTVLTSLTLPALISISGCGSESADPPAAMAGTANVAGATTGGAGATSVAGGGTTAGGTTGGAGTTSVAGGGTTGGAGTTGAAGAAGVVCDAPATIFAIDGDQGCAGAICHIAANATMYPPDLVSPGVAERLKDVVSTTAGCNGRKYIDSTNIEASIMLTKLVNPPSCGAAAMPFAKPALLPQDKIDCIRSWITSVATTP
jgi:hypothetical protein